jgi:signal transduction histidine kinase
MGIDSGNPDPAGRPALRGALNNLVETLPGSFLVLEPDAYRIVAASRAFLEITGRSREQLVGRILTEAFPNEPGDPRSNGATMLRQSLDRVKATGRGDTLGLRRHAIAVQTATGERFVERFWHPESIPVTDDEGRLCWIILRAEDVTEMVDRDRTDPDGDPQQELEHRRLRREMAGANTELQARRAQLEQAQQLAGIHSFELDPLSGRLHWSDRLQPQTDSDTPPSPETLRAFLEWTHPRDRERMRALLRDLPRQDGPEHLTVRMIRPADGAERSIHVIAQHLAGEHGPRIAGLVQDVTRITRQKAELEEATHGLRMAGRLARVGTWRGRTDDDRVHWSAMTAEIHGRPELREVDTAAALGFYAEADRARIAAALEACSVRGEARDETGRLITASGETVWVRVMAEPEMDAEGRVVAVRGVFQDITELRRLDERARHSQKLEAVGQLTGGVAHDFNNLLTVILGNAETLGETLTEPGQRALAEMTVNAAERGAELTSRLLAFARRQALAPARLDINRLIAGMDGLLQRSLRADIEIAFDPAADAWPVELDPGQLEVALLNLAVNARDAMPDGGRLRLATANVRVGSHEADPDRGRLAGDYVRVQVTDTGTGIEAVLLDRVFEPFFTTKDVGRGSGLGLSMVYGFVRQSGGFAELHSEPGRGTCVELHFPRAASGPMQRTPPRARPDPRGGRERILVVDPDPMVRSSLSRQLTSLGYHIVTTATGPEALAELKRAEPFDLLLTDLVLPGGISGRELAQRARALQPGLRVLHTSGQADAESAPDPDPDLLHKPWRGHDLAIRVRRTLDDHAESTTP